MAALRAVCAHRFGSDALAGRSFAVLGLGRVGERVARLLAAAGARLVAADVDPAKQALAGELGGAWVSPADCLTAAVDVLVPAALGGLLTAATVPELRCSAVAGPANNQLDAPATAGLLHDRGILWAPDFVVSAGGVIHGARGGRRRTGPAADRQRNEKRRRFFWRPKPASVSAPCLSSRVPRLGPFLASIRSLSLRAPAAASGTATAMITKRRIRLISMSVSQVGGELPGVYPPQESNTRSIAARDRRVSRR